MIARYLGLAEETEFNGATPPEANVHVDIASASLDTPGGTQIIYGGGLQRSAITHRPGFYSPGGNIVYAFDIETIGFLLKWALGGYDFTADGGELETHNLHKFYGSPDNVLPSFVARIGKDHFEHVFTGCVINSLEISVEGEFCQATAEIVSAKDAKAPLKAIESLSLPDGYPLAFYDVTMNLDGSPLSCEVKSLTLSISNNQNAESGRGLGSRHPCRIIAGERETTFSTELFFENTNALEKYWGGTDGPTDAGSTEFPIDLTFDSGEHGKMTIKLPKALYTEVQQQPSGREEISQSVSGRAMMGTFEIEPEVLEPATPAVTVTTEIGVELENKNATY